MTSNTEEQPLFREVQYMRLPLLWMLILAGCGLVLYFSIALLVLDEPINYNKGAFVSLLALGYIIGAGFPLLMVTMHLITEVKEGTLYYRYVPFHLSLQKIPCDQIKSHQVISYSPIKAYGGWGIRYWLKGKAYSVSGNRGLRLELISGTRILIGSQKPEELAHAIEAALQKA